jgi:hypothetical protein
MSPIEEVVLFAVGVMTLVNVACVAVCVKALSECMKNLLQTRLK